MGSLYDWHWSKDGEFKHGYLDFSDDMTCELKDLLGKVHTDFEDSTDYCYWSVTLQPVGVEIAFDIPQPGSQLSDEDGEWITEGRITREDISAACHPFDDGYGC
jgi:hypothetical protein